MTAATISTPRLALLDRLNAADLEVDRLLARLQELEHRLAGARRHLAVPLSAPRHLLGRAYLRQLEDDYEEALGQLREARREVLDLVRVD